MRSISGGGEELWHRIRAGISRSAHFRQHSRWQRYGTAVALSIFTLWLKWVTYYIFSHQPTFLLLTVCVTIAAWIGGFESGLIAMLVTAVGNYFIFLRPDHAFSPASSALSTTIFIIESLMIAAMSEARQQMDEQKIHFIGFAAHEIKNPLTAIKGYTGMVKNRTRDEKSRSFLRAIDTQTDRIIGIISDLLDITKIEFGRFTYCDEYFSIDALVSEIVMSQQVICPGRDISLEGSSRIFVHGDRYRVGQVLINLISNALKYSPEHTGIQVRILGRPTSVVVSVRDSGLGIAPHEQRRIFERYYRTNMVKRSRKEGLGLGLFICSEIMKRHKGRIWVRSKIGKGSTFYAELPKQIRKATRNDV